jgi:hypothetical protein
VLASPPAPKVLKPVVENAWSDAYDRCETELDAG